MSEQPRVAAGGLRELGPLNWAIVRIAGAAMGVRHPGVFATLGRHRSLFRGWLMFAGRMMPGGKLPRRETELVILRVAHLTQSAYEWDHHTRLAAKAGITPGEIDRVTAATPDHDWAPADRALLVATDELHAAGDLTDATWHQLSLHFDEPRRIELVLLVGHYLMLATALRTFRVPVDVHRR